MMTRPRLCFLRPGALKLVAKGLGIFFYLVTLNLSTADELSQGLFRLNYLELEREEIRRSPDLRDWVPEDDLVHFILEAVQRLPSEDFQVNHRGSGNRQFPHT